MNLAASDRSDDGETASTTNGRITIMTGGNLTVADSSGVNDGRELTGDIEVSAGGDGGRIEFDVAGTFTNGDNVQMTASQQRLVRYGSMQVMPSSVIAFRLSTGNDVGVARLFFGSARPRAYRDRILR